MSNIIRVLLIEDNAIDARLVSIALNDPGFMHERCETLKSAIVRLPGGNFDAILVDLGLPDSQGAHSVAELFKTATVPIVALTGDELRSTEISSLKAGAAEFVPKSHVNRTGELMRVLRLVVERWHEKEVVMGKYAGVVQRIQEQQDDVAQARSEGIMHTAKVAAEELVEEAEIVAEELVEMAEVVAEKLKGGEK